MTLYREDFGHHLKKLQQLNINAEVFLKNKKVKRAIDQVRKAFKIIDNDFVEIYNKLPPKPEEEPQ